MNRYITEREEDFIRTNGNTAYFMVFYPTQEDKDAYLKQISDRFSKINEAVVK